MSTNDMPPPFRLIDPPPNPEPLPPVAKDAEPLSYRYATADETIVIRNDGAVIPNDPDNRDRIEYEQWVELGGITDPYIVPPLIPPPPISRRQFYQELANMGSITQKDALGTMKTGALPNTIDNYIRSSSVPDDVEFECEMYFTGAMNMAIDNQWVQGLAAYIHGPNSGPDEMREMWIRAAKL